MATKIIFPSETKWWNNQRTTVKELLAWLMRSKNFSGNLLNLDVQLR